MFTVNLMFFIFALIEAGLKNDIFIKFNFKIIFQYYIGNISNKNK